MLIFNTNIYEKGQQPISQIKYSQSWPGTAGSGLDPYSLILSTLSSDRQIFHDLIHQSPQESQKQLEILFPHASRFGNSKILNSISKRLLEGLVNQNTWLKMNSYHFSYLYDTLSGQIEDYCYSNEDQRRDIIPELDGESIDFNWFLNTYFFHTAFLVDPDRFFSMDSDRKTWLEKWSPCLFSVVNSLTPSEEETQLTEHSSTPYLSLNKDSD
jgi:hypothetical protein